MTLKKPNILVVGSFMMDLIASTRRVPNSGETVIGMKFQTAPGGKGANQAVQCARLGAHVTMVGQVGDDAFGKIMTDTAAAAGGSPAPRRAWIALDLRVCMLPVRAVALPTEGVD